MRRVALGLVIVLALLSVGLVVGLWSATNQLLFPSFRGVTRDLAACPAGLDASWGPACGNLRLSRRLDFHEIRIPAPNDVSLPGWHLGTAATPVRGVAVLVHGGGSDRREMTRHARMFLDRGFDVITFDLACHGEAPCPVSGLSYGDRESGDVLAAYRDVAARYERILMMGSSVGAASVLAALPSMPEVTAVVAEDPMASFERLVTEFPAAQGSPAFFMRLMLGLAKFRGQFDGRPAPLDALPLVRSGPPILFVHSRRGEVLRLPERDDLADAYAGPKETWFPDAGAHGAIRDANPVAYEERIGRFLDAALAARDGRPP